MGERLVRVESFEELRTGMRVVQRCGSCAKMETGFLDSPATATTISPGGGRRVQRTFLLKGGPCPIRAREACVSEGDVKMGAVFRFAVDSRISAKLARETNPYLERTTIGTGGRDEVRVAAKERAR